MAVLEAVRGWEELAKLPHINDVKKDGDSDAEEIKDAEKVEEVEAPEEELEEGEWTAEELEKDIDPLLNTDYVSLLLEHEEHIRSPLEGSMRKCWLPPPLSILTARSVRLISIYTRIDPALLRGVQRYPGLMDADPWHDSSRRRFLCRLVFLSSIVAV